MTQEEKAKRYDEVLEELRGLFEGIREEKCKILEEDITSIFPELQENEDERIRKELIFYLGDMPEDTELRNGVTNRDVLVWLENQGEQGNNEDEAILHRFSFYSYKDEPNILYLAGLYVNDEYRNKGIGTKILEVADKVSAYLKCNSIRLKTENGSVAETLYRKNGYKLLKEEGNQIWLEKQGEQKQDPCDNCKDVMLNCHNFPCIKKRAFKQGKSVFDAINEEKVDNANKAETKFKVGDERTKDSQTEYTRTDAFIKKACKFLNKELPITDLSPSNMFDITFKVFDRETKKVFIENFKKYMEGE